MKRFGRALLGIPIGITCGLLLLFWINLLFASTSPSIGVDGLIEQALYDRNWGNRIFAWALLYALFVVPILRSVKEGYSEDYSLVGHVLIPFIVSILSVITMFLIAFVISFIVTFIDSIFDADTIIGTVAVIAVFIAFCTPVTKAILIIFD